MYAMRIFKQFYCCTKKETFLVRLNPNFFSISYFIRFDWLKYFDQAYTQHNINLWRRFCF